MKKLIIFLSAISLLFLSNSCESFIEGWDENPNSPNEVTPDVLLTAAEATVIFHYTGQQARAASIFMQHSAGVLDQSKDDYQTYGMDEGGVNNEWNSLYSDCLETCQYLIQEYGDENPHYAGIAQVIQALGLGMLTDYWGDVPFSQALRGLEGEEYLAPPADTQEEILNSIQTLCSNAITNLQADDASNAYPVGTDDVIFNGDTDAWIAAAWVIKARYANRLSEVNAASSATDALSFLQSAYNAGFTANANNLLGVTGTNATDANQWDDFQNQRGYMRANATLVDMMEAQNDPRLPFYFQDLTIADPSAPDPFVGSGLGEDNPNASNFGTFVRAVPQSFPMVTYFEAKFIEAEAEFRSGNLAAAAAAHNEAILASVEFFTETTAPTDFETAVASEDASSITLETIMTQKYISMFTQPEVWSDWRRTDYPALVPDPRGAINSIPVRFPTPRDERTYNPNITPVSNLTTPVWWDQ